MPHITKEQYEKALAQRDVLQSTVDNLHRTLRQAEAHEQDRRSREREKSELALQIDLVLERALNPLLNRARELGLVVGIQFAQDAMGRPIALAQIMQHLFREESPVQQATSPPTKLTDFESLLKK